MDGFEARLQYIQMLKSLRSAKQLQLDPVKFTMRHPEHHEDFVKCILETLPTMSFNDRVNVLCYIRNLFSALHAESALMKLIQEHYTAILALVIPQKSIPALCNLSEAIKVTQVVTQDSEPLAIEPLSALNLASIKEGKFDYSDWIIDGTDLEDARGVLLDRLKFEQYIKHFCMENGTVPADLLPREEVLTRMEADRERHKKCKETKWVVDRAPGILLADSEFEKMWESLGPLEKNDLVDLRDLDSIAKQSYFIK